MSESIHLSSSIPQPSFPLTINYCPSLSRFNTADLSPSSLLMSETTRSEILTTFTKLDSVGDYRSLSDGRIFTRMYCVSGGLFLAFAAFLATGAGISASIGPDRAANGGEAPFIVALFSGVALLTVIALFARAVVVRAREFRRFAEIERAFLARAERRLGAELSLRPKHRPIGWALLRALGGFEAVEFSVCVEKADSRAADDSLEVRLVHNG